MELALVNGLLPVDVEGSFDNGCHLVNIVSIESNDSQTEDVGDVVKGLVLLTFELKFAGQRLLFLDTMFNRSHIDALLAERPAQLVIGQRLHAFEDGSPFLILTDDFLTVRI